MTKRKDSVTEKKIKQAAREIFLEKGLSGSRTRDITEKAGVNLALLNYYFGGKEQLFYTVISEILEDFRSTMFSILDDHSTSLEEKIELLTDKYYETLAEDVKLFPFVVDLIRDNIDNAREHIKSGKGSIANTHIAQQYIELTGKTITDFRIFYINLLGLIAFPVAGAPLLTAFFDYTDEQYFELLLKRKEFILKILPHLY